MESPEKEGTEKTAIDECVNLKIPKTVLDFAEFYAEIGSISRDDLLTKIIIERLKEIKEQFKALPHIDIQELW